MYRKSYIDIYWIKNYLILGLRFVWIAYLLGSQTSMKVFLVEYSDYYKTQLYQKAQYM